MKVLLANWVYNWGSTGYILRDLGNGLKEQGVDVYPACGISYCSQAENVFAFSSHSERSSYGRFARLGVSRLRGSTASSKRLIQHIEEVKPDVVNLHLLHCNTINLYHLLRYLAQHHVKTILTHHAELYYTGTCGHAYDCNKWQNEECRGCEAPNRATESYCFARPHRHWKEMSDSINGFSPEFFRNTAVSPWLAERVRQSSMMRLFSCDVVMNGVDTDVYQRRKASARVQDKLRGVIGQYALYVSANFNPLDKNDIKGGYYIVKLAEMMPETTFVVVATSSSNCEDLPRNVVFWGKAESQQELAELYSNAAMTVLTSMRETFSMICAETLCCGTPVIGFLAGGPESIAIREYSDFVENANLESLKQLVVKYKDERFDRNKISEVAIKKYSRKAMTDGYLSTYNKLLELQA